MEKIQNWIKKERGEREVGQVKIKTESLCKPRMGLEKKVTSGGKGEVEGRSWVKRKKYK